MAMCTCGRPAKVIAEHVSPELAAVEETDRVRVVLAAPEMLEALRQIEQIAGDASLDTWGGKIATIWVKARDAIREAEGQP